MFFYGFSGMIKDLQGRSKNYDIFISQSHIKCKARQYLCLAEELGHHIKYYKHVLMKTASTGMELQMDIPSQQGLQSICTYLIH